MATQTIMTLTAENKTFYQRTLLERLLPSLIHGQWGQKRSIPKREGSTINFRRFNSLAAATTPLTEGVTPAGNSLSIATVTASPLQYGDFVEISDMLDMVGIDPVITETTELLGEQAGDTFDQIVRDVVAAGTGLQYANGRASRATIVATDVLNSVEIRKAVRTLKRNKVKPVEGGFYIGIVHPDASYDLQSDTMWQDVSKYSNAEAIFKGEIGKMWGVRFIETTNAKKYAGAGSGGVDVFGTLVLGANYYGIVDVAGSQKPDVIVKPFGSAGTADPLEQRSTVAWKSMFTAVRLQELACVRIEHGATA